MRLIIRIARIIIIDDRSHCQGIFQILSRDFSQKTQICGEKSVFGGGELFLRIKGEIVLRMIKGEIVPQISPLEPHMARGGPRDPQNEVYRNGEVNIDAIVF